MKKNNKEIARLRNLIEHDRINCYENFNDLIVNDIDKVLMDYFEYNGKPILEINKESGNIEVKIILSATNCKWFMFSAK